jgi:carboxyl-terminal processing protease
MSTRKIRSLGLVSVGVIAGVLLSLGLSAVAQRGSPLPLDELRQFSSVFSAIKNNYVEPVSDKKLISGAISGMLSDLDPHSAYLDADAFKEMQSATQGEFGGLGIEVGTEDGMVKVISPIEDTPAARAGIRAGKMLPDNIGYIRIAQFQEKTGVDLVRHLKELGEKGAPRGLILDLRNDPGGLLTSAIGVSAAFLKPDTLVVSTDGRAPDAKQKYLSNPADYARGERDYLVGLPAWVKTVPMVVLVNVGSASASEIVAGALQDHKRATVMGNRTFGKGSVQVILPISDTTAIKLTTSRYYTPKGRSIQATGIMPDIVVADTAEGDLFRMSREADLKRHLSNSRSGQPEPEKKTKEEEAPLADTDKIFQFGTPEDFQLNQAVNFLEGKPIQKAVPRPKKASAEPSGDATKGK